VVFLSKSDHFFKVISNRLKRRWIHPPGKDEIMVNESLVLKIRELRFSRGMTYDEISRALHIGRSTISKVLKAESRVGRSRTVIPASLLNGESSYISKNASIENGSVSDSAKNNNPGSHEGTDSITRMKLVADQDGLRMVSMDNPEPFLNSHSIISAPFPSWFWRLFFILFAILVLIGILRKMREEALEDE